MFTLVIFLMFNGGYQKIESVERIKTEAECQKAGEAALKAWKNPQTQVTFVCLSGKG